MMTHYVSAWTGAGIGLKEALAVASPGDTIEITVPTLVATENLTVAMSLNIMVGRGLASCTIDYSTGFRLLWAGDGAGTQVINMIGPFIVNQGGDATADAFRFDANLGNLVFNGTWITVNDVGGNHRAFVGHNTGAASTYGWIVNLRGCAVHHVGLVGAAGTASDSYSGVITNAGATGTMNLYGCTSEGSYDQCLTTHTGCALNAWDCRVENIVCIDNLTTVYCQDCTFTNPAGKVSYAIVGDGGSDTSVTHTFRDCWFYQYADQNFVDCRNTMTFWDCHFILASTTTTNHPLRTMISGAVLSLYRCKLDMRLGTAIPTAKVTLLAVAGATLNIEGCCILAPKVGAGISHYVVQYAATSVGNLIHNTLVGYRNDAAVGTIRGVYYGAAEIVAKFNIIAGFDEGLNDVGDAYHNSVVCDYNLFYDNAVDITGDAGQVNDMLATDPLFDAYPPATFEDTHIDDVTPSPAARIDPAPAFQIPSFGWTYNNALGATGVVTPAWNAAEPGSAAEPLDGGCWTNTVYTQRRIAVALDQDRNLTLFAGSPGRLFNNQQGTD